MSACSVSHNLAFIHIPKCAGTSIRYRLQGISDWFNFDTLDEQIRETRNAALANHFPIYKVQELLQQAGSDIDFDGMFKFMVVRNPWERMVSLYHHRLRKLDMYYQGKPRATEEDKKVARSGFVPWLTSTPNEGDKVLTRMAQARWGYNIDNYYAVERVLFQESLEQEWPDFCREVGLPEQPLPRKNTGAGTSKEYRIFYNEEAKRHVEEHFAEDIERYGYSF